MPINACSINAFTINALRCNSVIPTLPNKNAVKRPASIPGLVQQRRYVEREDDTVDNNIESLFIEFTVDLLGIKYTCSFENLPDAYEPIIYASNVTISETSPYLAIENLRIEMKHE